MLRESLCVLFLAAACLASAQLDGSPPSNSPFPSDAELGPGLDTGGSARSLAQCVDAIGGISNRSSKVVRWMRLRGLPLDNQPSTRADLQVLRSSGVRTCVLLRRPTVHWKASYLPDDLREAFEHAQRLGVAYGDVVDAWEVDNEPDLGFVPESAERYTAFLKATYLGLKAGFRRRLEQGPTSTSAHHIGASTGIVGAAEGPLVIMGGLGLPPGPWLERFAANDGFAYTDGYSFHYYGYEEDLSDVYAQHQAAAEELAKSNATPSQIYRPLPIFITEIGYGILGKASALTKAGRVRQWRWFKAAAEQVSRLRPEGAMAFYLPPYLEYGLSEFGLTVPAKAPRSTTAAENGLLTEWEAGGIAFSPQDFDSLGAEPWMDNIGKEIAGFQATPALAQWLSTRYSLPPVPANSIHSVDSPLAGKPDASTRWLVARNPHSPLVLDFLAGEGLNHVKRYNGMFVTNREPVRARDLVSRESQPSAQPKPNLPAPSLTGTGPSEEFILQVRTQKGNLYEVYPTRQATTTWQNFLEPHDNFTMAFYGRAALPWRFADNQPISLVFVMYPKSLPATFEFRRMRLINFSVSNNQPSENFRYGRGTLVLYNFSDQPVTGRLTLPKSIELESEDPLHGLHSPNPQSVELTLGPGERREIQVSVKVNAARYERIASEITFQPVNRDFPTARHVTALIPDIGGMSYQVAANLFQHREIGTEFLDLLARRRRAREEVSNFPDADPNLMPSGPRSLLPPGVDFNETEAGFAVTITEPPIGGHQRIEVEIPWPEGRTFDPGQFLSLDFRLRPRN